MQLGARAGTLDEGAGVRVDERGCAAYQTDMAPYRARPRGIDCEAWDPRACGQLGSDSGDLGEVFGCGARGGVRRAAIRDADSPDGSAGGVPDSGVQCGTFALRDCVGAVGTASVVVFSAVVYVEGVGDR